MVKRKQTDSSDAAPDPREGAAGAVGGGTEGGPSGATGSAGGQPEAAPAATDGAAALEQKIAQLTDQLLRKAAEFENYKKRTENENSATVRFANESLLLKLVPVLDDIDRWIKSHSGAEGGNPDKGLELIFTKFRKTLEQIGLTPFDSVGKPFDPDLHDAMLQVPRTDLPHHTVVEEVDRGYRYHDRMLRHARVIVSAQVAKPPAENANGTVQEPEDDDIGGEG